MTIILFLIDTSASMCQKAHVNGVQKSYLDIAKGAVETFLKYRQRSQDCMGDRYMLLTFEDPPCNVKAGWKENHATFMNELKNLQSTGLTSMGEALKNAFDLLNLNRMQSGIDTYGQGRCPFYLEPSVIIVITDGGKYSFRNGVHVDITLPLNAQIPGTKFTKEPFRWDQRLFSLVLRMAGNKLDERVEGKVPHDDSPIERMCEVTGGRSYRIKSHYVLNQCIESLVQKVQPGVVVHFEQLLTKELKDGEIQDLAFQTTKKMIYVHKHPAQKSFPAGYWPIPEPYWPDPKAITLPPRDAHPKIKILTPCVEEPQTVRNFPIDKYELEASPLTLQILSKRELTKCWAVVISNGMQGLEMPFGYLKANSTFTQVYLMVLPYNYPSLLPLLNDLFNKYTINPPNDWIYKFSNYVRSIPQYYSPFLRRALMSANVPYPLLQYILPESLDGYLSPTIANYLKQMKNTAKLDQEALCLRVFKQLKIPKPPYHPIETTKLHCGLPFKRDLVTHPMLKDAFNKLHNDISTYENYTIVVPSLFSSVPAKNYRNPFDIPRRDLIEDIGRMRENFFKVPSSGVNIYTKDVGHSLPIAEMGNYQEYLKNKEPPLREIEPTNVRQHMFGNPYKKDKHMVMVDEADLGEVAPMRAMNAPNTPKKNDLGKINRKRKAGPIHKDFIFRRSSMGSHDGLNISQLSDGDDSSMSDTSSTISDDGDDNRLIVDFEFNEQPDDFSINGHIQDFINGDVEESDQSSNISDSTNSSSTNSATYNVANNSPPSDIPSASANAYNASPIITVSHGYQNDINDVENISKILQQCHNGVNSNSSNNENNQHKMSSISNNSNGENHINHQNINIEEVAIKCEPPPPKKVKTAKPTTNVAEVETVAVVVVSEENSIHINNNHNSNNNTNSINNSNGNNSNVTNSPSPDDHSNVYNNQLENGDDTTNDELRESIRLENIEIRSMVFKDIRRPGRDYSVLLEHLNLFKGDFSTRFSCIQMCINEALRFRRRKMADSIQDWWEKQIDKMNS